MVQAAMEDIHLLVSLSNSHGQNFILKLSVSSNVMKVVLTDKSTAEKWRCTYDSFYVENLSRKTGNFKQFDVFVSMLRAGLLKTNECVYVELLTQCELEARRRRGTGKKAGRTDERNRKYLILVYQVEFDKIHYPLPLEYCGRPSPDVLQATVRKLEKQVLALRNELTQERLKSKHEVCSREEDLQNLLEKLNNENARLYEEINRLSTLPGGRTTTNRKQEDALKKERVAFLDRIYRLEIENRKLTSLLTGRALRSRESPLRNRRSRSLERNSLSLESFLSQVNSGKKERFTSSTSMRSFERAVTRNRSVSSERLGTSDKPKLKNSNRKK